MNSVVLWWLYIVCTFFHHRSQMFLPVSSFLCDF